MNQGSLGAVERDVVNNAVIPYTRDIQYARRKLSDTWLQGPRTGVEDVNRPGDAVVVNVEIPRLVLGGRLDAVVDVGVAFTRAEIAAQRSVWYW